MLVHLEPAACRMRFPRGERLARAPTTAAASQAQILRQILRGDPPKIFRKDADHPELVPGQDLRVRVLFLVRVRR